MEWTENQTESTPTATTLTFESRTIRTVVNDLLELIDKTESLVDSSVLNPEEEDVNKKVSDEEEKDPIICELDDYFGSLPAADDDDTDTDETNECEDRLNCNIRGCDACKVRESLYWRRVTRRLHVCNACFFKKTYLILFSDDNMRKLSGAAETSTTTLTNNSSNDSKKKKLKSNNGRKQETSSSSRPLTRTALNGTTNGKNGGGKAQSQANSVNSPSSNTSQIPNVTQIKIEPTISQTSASNPNTTGVNVNPSVSNPNVDDDCKDSDIKKNLRKSARISQSKTNKTKTKYTSR